MKWGWWKLLQVNTALAEGESMEEALVSIARAGPVRGRYPFPTEHYRCWFIMFVGPPVYRRLLQSYRRQILMSGWFWPQLELCFSTVERGIEKWTVEGILFWRPVDRWVVRLPRRLLVQNIVLRGDLPGYETGTDYRQFFHFRIDSLTRGETDDVS